MKNCALLIFFCLTSFVVLAGEPPKWIAHEKYSSDKDIDKAFQLAREYFLEKYKNNSEKVDYEYYAYSTENGFVVSITPMYLGKDGKYSVVVDGDECIYLNKSFNIKGMRQCLAPTIDLLSE